MHAVGAGNVCLMVKFLHGDVVNPTNGKEMRRNRGLFLYLQTHLNAIVVSVSAVARDFLFYSQCAEFRVRKSGDSQYFAAEEIQRTVWRRI